MMRHPTVKLAGGEEKEEKKATKSKRVGFQEADDDKLERNGEVSKHCQRQCFGPEALSL